MTPGTSKIGAGIVVGLLIVALAVTAMRFKVTTELGLFLPSGQNVLEQVLMGYLERGSTSNLVFAGIEGDAPEVLAEISKRFASGIAEEEGIVQVLNGATRISDADRDWVFDNRYHLTPTALADQFSRQGLKRSMEDRLRGLASPLAALEKKFLARDPTGEILSLLNRWRGAITGEHGPDKLHGVWFSPDQKRAVMLIELASSGLDLAGQQRSVNTLYSVFSRVKSPTALLKLSGPSVFAVETRKFITADVRYLSIVATTLVALFLIAIFRSGRLLLLVLAPILSGIVVASAIVLLMFGSIHGITLAFGITLIGVAVDYPIHFFSHLKGGRDSAEDSIRTIWKTLSLGVLSTIVAYAALAFSEFRGLQQLGVFTVSGLLAAAAVTRWVLPFLLPKTVALHQGMRPLQHVLEKAAKRLSGKGIWSLVLIPLSLGVIWLNETPIRDLDLDALSPISQERRTEDKGLRNDLGFWYGGKLAAIVAPDSETALRRSEALRKDLDALIEQRAFSRYDMAASFLPSQSRQKSQIRAIPDELELRQRLAAAIAGSPLREDVFEPFIEEAQQARQQPLLTVESLGQSPMGERLKSLLFEHNDMWVALILLHGVINENALQGLNKDEGDVQVLYLNVLASAEAILEKALDRVTPLLAAGVGMIYLLLAFAFRSVTRPLFILLPTLSAVAATVAILNLSGIPMTLMHLVSLLLIIGLGLDYALFYNRLNDCAYEWDTTFRALWVCAFTTVLVFGILVISRNATPTGYWCYGRNRSYIEPDAWRLLDAADGPALNNLTPGEYAVSDKN